MSLVLTRSISPTILEITLNDPDNLNAMGEEMAEEFSQLTSRLFEDRTLRAIVLTGAGRAFSAGGHLEMLEKKQQLSGEENRRLMHRFYRSFLSILDIGVPLIAAINGAAVGAGLCLASACDIRVAAEHAKLGFTFTRLGLHPGMAATYFLPRILGIAGASELLLTGRIITAIEGRDMGLVSHVVAQEEVVPRAIRIAEEIAECGPESVRQLLETLRGGYTTLDATLEREALCQSLSYASKEFGEGVRAAREKRKPTF
jgi:enoyl-CoA hydratase/carnithine racemase